MVREEERRDACVSTGFSVIESVRRSLIFLDGTPAGTVSHREIPLCVKCLVGVGVGEAVREA